MKVLIGELAYVILALCEVLGVIGIICLTIAVIKLTKECLRKYDNKNGKTQTKKRADSKLQ